MPIYKRGPARWEVRIYRDGRPAARIVRGSKADAEAFEARWRVELEAGAALSTRVAPTFSDFFRQQYGPHAQAHLKESTWRNRRYQLATLDAAIGDLQLTRLTAAEVETYKHARLRAGIAHGTINDELKVLRAALNFAKRIGIPTALPRWDRLPQRRRRKVMAWTAVEVDRLYRAVQAESPAILPLVVCLVNTGMRRGEAIALRWESVDLERDLLRVWPNDEWEPKDGEAREVPIGAALRPFLDLAGPAEAPVFPTRAGAAYAFWPQRQFDRARVAAGLTGGPHTTRHTYATHFLARRPDLHLLAQVLGHSHTRVTQLYAHLLPDHLERARDAVCLPAPLALVPQTRSEHALPAAAGISCVSETNLPSDSAKVR